MAKAKTKDKEEALPKSDKPMSNQAFMSMMNKKLGEEMLFAFDGESSVKVQPVSTGVPSLDFALGIGGLPWGRTVEIYGPESSGKTTIALKTIAEFQKNSKIIPHVFYGKKAIFIDAEHALDPFHAQALGVDISAETGMIIIQPNNGEEAYDSIVSLILSGQVGMIVGDSLPSFIPKTVINGSAEDNHMMIAARLNSQMIPVITQYAQKNDVLFIMINQIREKPTMYGNPETTPGGRALKFYASVRLEVRRKVIEKSGSHLGQTMFVKVIKNKVSRPYTKAEFDYYWDTGIDVVKDIMNVAMDMDIIKRAGAWYYYGEDSKNPFEDGAGNPLKWQGKETVEAVLKQSPALFDYTNDIVQGRIPKDAQFIDEEHDENEVLEEEVALQKEEVLV
ncbi:DNA recombination/repair protein RecA (plasmid) [Bacillus thuringiensis]|uniref:DNA recombination/repair protein RecA n=1 Tax=Bacillus thuringiensis TaxID=1428 RepID=UPI002223FEF8|nr:DNA recombination/repair protein RecA [Bacillus thuringiensis]UYX56031.1 DNA recombination/repair protein RecA [Bacillus thuringiensis]